MDMALWNGVVLRRLLLSADLFNDSAIFSGSFDLKTPPSRSSASLVSVTFADHFFVAISSLLSCFILLPFRRCRVLLWRSFLPGIYRHWRCFLPILIRLYPVLPNQAEL